MPVRKTLPIAIYRPLLLAALFVSSLGILNHAATVTTPVLAFPLPQPRSAHAAELNDRPLNNSDAPRTIRVGVYENKPKIFTAENGRADGIFIEIIEFIAKQEQWQLHYVPCRWAECLHALEAGDIDLMPDVAFSQARQRSLDFHQEEVIQSWSQVYSNPNVSVQSWSDLDGRKLGILKGSVQQEYLEQMLAGFGYTNSLVALNSFEEAFALAQAGTVDAVVSNHHFGNYYYAEYDLQPTGLVFNPSLLYYAATPGTHPELLAAIDMHLGRMKSAPGSVYFTAQERWLEGPLPVVHSRTPLWLFIGMTGLLAAALLMIAVLRQQVRKRTRHLVAVNETLRQSEEKFKSLFHNHSAIKMILDAQTWRIVEANTAAERFYGWSGEELRRTRVQDITVGSTEETTDLMTRAMDGNGTQCAFRHRIADGSLRDVEVYCSRIELEHTTRIHWVMRDVTEQVQLEEQYRQAQKLEFLGRLVGGVAHDYNNMLSVILSYAESAMDKVNPGDDVYADLKEIEHASQRSQAITSQLLAFARKQTISPKVININDTVQGFLPILQRLTGKEVNLVWHPATGPWCVKMDVAQLHQVLSNLCINARDASAAGGDITITTETLTLETGDTGHYAELEAGDFVVLSVSDTGTGMERATLDEMFDPFFTTKATGQGTGLGLATVWGIVKQNDGFISAYSEPGEGTTIKVLLPRCTEEVSNEPRQAAPEKQGGQGETLLIVEDEGALLKVAQRILTKLNYNVLAADSPSMALQLAEEHAGRIDLLITDVIMPEMNGRELADQIQTLRPGIKCAFMSGYTADVLARKNVFDAAFHFIPKPFTAKDLTSKVRQVLDEEEPIA